VRIPTDDDLARFDEAQRREIQLQVSASRSIEEHSRRRNLTMRRSRERNDPIGLDET
jgi:hypothetical protein